MRKFLVPVFLADGGAAMAAPSRRHARLYGQAVKPGDDFFLYGNGAWIAKAAIPAERAYAGINLELNKQNDDRLKGIAEGLLKKPRPPPKNASCAISMPASWMCAPSMRRG